VVRLNYRKAFPEGFRALANLEASLHDSPLEPRLLELVKIRASQINGCAFCLAMHARDARAKGETQTRLDTLVAWRETSFFSARERAALAWCEALTELPREGAPHGLYGALESEFTPEEVAALTFAIVTINAWNRLAVAFQSDVTTLEGLELPQGD
jgi:AhpD family alkylhydroperoxidase